MHTLRLHTIVCQNFIFLLAFFLITQACSLQFCYLATHIWKHKELRIFHIARQGIYTFVRKFNSLMLLINHKVEFIGCYMHMLLILLHIELFCLLQAHFHTWLAQIFNQRFALRHTLKAAEQSQLTCLAFFLIHTAHLGLCFCQQFSGQGVLGAYQQLHAMLVLVIHLVFTLWYWTTDNQWCTSIINQHRVYLIHNSEVMTALHEIHWARSHIIAQVVKTKLIVGTKSDIACIRTATFI